MKKALTKNKILFTFISTKFTNHYKEGLWYLKNLQIEFLPYYQNKPYKTLRVRVYFYLPSGKKKEKVFTCNTESTITHKIINAHTGEEFRISEVDFRKIYKFIFDLENLLERGENLEKMFLPQPTLIKYIDTFCYNLLQENLKKWDCVYVLNIIKGYFEKRKINDINKMDIERYKFYLNKTKYSNSSKRKILLVLRKIFEYAEIDGMINKTPFKNIKLPAGKGNRVYPISKEDLSNIFNTLKIDIEQKYLFDYCKLLFYTGLRCSDIINLKYENISINRDIKVFQLIESKNKNKPSREITTIPIHKELYYILDLKKDKNSYILEYPYKRSNARFLLSKKFKETFNNYNPKQFRHTFASYLSDNYIPDNIVNVLMGKSATGTLQYYRLNDIDVLNNAIQSLPTIEKITEKEKKKETVGA